MRVDEVTKLTIVLQVVALIVVVGTFTYFNGQLEKKFDKLDDSLKDTHVSLKATLNDLQVAQEKNIKNFGSDINKEILSITNINESLTGISRDVGEIKNVVNNVNNKTSSLDKTLDKIEKKLDVRFDQLEELIQKRNIKNEN